jgi:hypothetical protein
MALFFCYKFALDIIIIFPIWMTQRTQILKSHVFLFTDILLFHLQIVNALDASRSENMPSTVLFSRLDKFRVMPNSLLRPFSIATWLNSVCSSILIVENRKVIDARELKMESLRFSDLVSCPYLFIYLHLHCW